MKTTKGAKTPRRSALWVRGRHHKIAKILATMEGISPIGIVVERALDRYLEGLPDDQQAAVLASLA
jgi:hypothetical protein